MTPLPPRCWLAFASTAIPMLVVLLSVPGVAWSGTPWEPQPNITASDGAPGDEFGFSIALSGDTALVGAINDETAAGVKAGSAYVLLRSAAGWSEQQKLVPAETLAYGQFGLSVALSGDTAIIGASSASVHVFVRVNGVWREQQRLVPIGGTPAGFGHSVALSGDIALVGAPFDDTTQGDMAGSAYVFVRSGGVWAQQQKLTSSDGAARDWFGYSVALSGEAALVGAPFHDDPYAGADAGLVYGFVWDGTAWSEQQKLNASDGAPFDRFGSSVALSENMALVGAPFDDDSVAGAEAGSAYVFARSSEGWSQKQKLRPDNGAAGDYLGASVALSAENALVGGASAYVFARNGSVWSQQQELAASEAKALNASSLALSGGTALVGDASTGSVYPFELSPAPPSPAVGGGSSGGALGGGLLAALAALLGFRRFGQKSPAPMGISRAAVSALALLFGAPCASAQEAAGQAVYLETMGPAFVALNFDMRLSSHFSARVGAGRLKYDTSLFGTVMKEASVVPVTLSFLAGRGPGHFEACAGVVAGEGETGGTIGLGYRYQNPRSNGWLVRAGVSAFGFDGGLAAGYSLSIGRSW